jgi:hypothetical protein
MSVRAQLCTRLCVSQLHIQGDQMGRFSASWAIIYFELFNEKYSSSPNLLAAYFRGKLYVLILTKTGWATLWAIFNKLICSP